MNNDLISREELKKVLNEQINFDENCRDSVFDIIDNAPTILHDNYSMGYQDGVRKVLSERPHSEWIPVSERLPEEKFTGGAFGFDFGEVLCTTIWGDVRNYKYGTSIGHDRPHFWYCGEIKDDCVIAWQPLPEPYKEADNETNIM